MIYKSCCKSELFFNSCPRWKYREEFFTPNLCIGYIPTHPAVHITTYFTSNSHTFQDKHFLPPLTFPHCPGLSWDAEKKTSMGVVESYLLCSWIAEISILKITRRQFLASLRSRTQVGCPVCQSICFEYKSAGYLIFGENLIVCLGSPLTSHHTSCLYLGSPPYSSSLGSMTYVSGQICS